MYSISDVAKILQVHSQTLRNWEKHGLIHPGRVGNVRIYSEADLQQCQAIRKYSRKGVHLGGIHELLNRQMPAT